MVGGVRTDRQVGTISSLANQAPLQSSDTEREREREREKD